MTSRDKILEILERILAIGSIRWDLDVIAEELEELMKESFYEGYDFAKKEDSLVEKAVEALSE